MNDSAVTSLQGEIRDHLRALRERARAEFHAAGAPRDTTRVVFTERRKGYLDGAYVDRLVLFLRGTGCAWTSQTGGCTFCGFWGATQFGGRVADADYKAQVIHALATAPADDPIVCLYNDGSMLVDREIGLEVVVDLCRLLAARAHVRRVVIEAKVIDLDARKIERLANVMNGKELEVAVGFESAEPIIRDLCINKGFPNALFEAKVRLLANQGISLVPLVMLKPPFLTEGQAVCDVVRTLEYLEPYGLARIDLELATVERHTLTHDLWSVGLYTTPRLWSVIEILRQRHARGFRTPLFVSPPNYTVPSVATTANCPSCTSTCARLLERYNATGDVAVFDGLVCDCKAAWELLLREPGADPLVTQVSGTLAELHRRSAAMLARPRQ